MSAQRKKGVVVSLAEARKTAPAPLQSHPHSAPASKSGYLESWYKEHEDRQGLIQESLRTQKENAEWERKYNDLKPTLGEHALYYVSVLGIVVTLLVWAGILVMKGL